MRSGMLSDFFLRRTVSTSRKRAGAGAASDRSHRVINRTEIRIADTHKYARLKPSLDHQRQFAALAESQEKCHAVGGVVVFQS